MKRIAIMQPYLFPYLGYFQLVAAVDGFVFYDDVQFIKRGWINRNRILVNGTDFLFTVPCAGASQHKQIREVVPQSGDKWCKKLLRTIEMAYKPAPFFTDFYPVVESVFQAEVASIAELAARSVTACADYLGLEPTFQFSSEAYPETREADRADRLIAICRAAGAETYINPQGGTELYEKAYFAERGIKLQFLRAGLAAYPQLRTDTFVPGLSMIDQLMNLSPDEVRQSHLTNYELF